MGDPRPLGGGSVLEQREHGERRAGEQQRLQCDREQDGHLLAPFALRARAIICSSSLNSSSPSLSDMPRSALAALAAEPLKKTRTMSDKADFLATVSERTGL